MRKSFLISVAIIGFALVALLFVVSPRPQRRLVNESSNEVAQQPLSSQAPVDDNKIASKAILTEPARPSVAAHVELSSAEKAMQLVKALGEIGQHTSELTPEQADNWKRNLEQLIEQGKAAVPILDEFFQTTGDVRFNSIPGGNLLEEPTLRIAFLKVLFDIPTPDNVELQERVLQTTTDPDEIALLVRQLELQEPGEHREVIVQAANSALRLAANGGLPGRDTTQLTKALAEFGIANVK